MSTVVPPPTSPPPAGRRGVGRRRVARFLAAMAGLCGVAAFPASAIFDLRTIAVEGNLAVPTDAVLHRAGLGPGTGAFRVNAAAIRERLLGDPRIEAVAVAMAFPHDLRVVIQERRPVAALVVGERTVLLSGDAVAIAEGPDTWGLPALVVDRLDPAEVMPGRVLRAPDARFGAQIAGTLPAPLRGRVVLVWITRDGEGVLRLREGISVRVGGPRGVMTRLEMVPQALDAIASRGLHVEVVDLRFSGNIVIQPARSSNAPSSPPRGRQENLPARGIDPAMHRPSNP